jgi:predicted transcriptional regulator
MSASETTTLRVPVDLRDEIAVLARRRGTTMVEVVAHAVHQLNREQWWEAVHDALDGMTTDDVAAYRKESRELEGPMADGLGGR